MSGKAVVVSGLTKRYGTVSAVTDVSFTSSSGEIVALLGPNGAGKSTAMAMMVGLIRGGGNCTFHGSRFAELDRPGRVVGVVLDGLGLLPGWSARQHLTAFAPAVGARNRDAEELVERVGLAQAGARPVRTYSRGMRQRLGLALALLGRPSVLVLDEPSTGLDPHGMRWLVETLRDFAAGGGSIVVSSHQLAEIETIADTVVLLEKGRVRDIDALPGFLRSNDPEVVRLQASEAALLLEPLRAAGACILDVEQETVRLTGVSAREVAVIALDRAIALHELTTEARDLTAAFFAASAPESAERSA